MIELIPTIELAEKSISFRVSEDIQKIIANAPDLLLFGEFHPTPSRFSPDIFNAETIARIISELSVKPAFIGVDLSSLNPTKLNEAGKSYFAGLAPLLTYSETNNIKIIPLADMDRELGTQSYEQEISRKIHEAVDEYGFGVSLLGSFHCRKLKTSGSEKFSPAAQLLSSKKKISSIRLHQLSPKNPGAKIVDSKQRIAYLSSSFIELYPDPEQVSRPDLFGRMKPDDFNGMVLLPTETSRMNHQWGASSDEGIEY